MKSRQTDYERFLLLAGLELPEAERELIRSGARAASRALNEAAAERQQARLAQAGRPVGRPKGRTTTPYFSRTHPLSERAAGLCGHRGVPKVGGIACGACWEQAIRSDALEDTIPGSSTVDTEGKVS